MLWFFFLLGLTTGAAAVHGWHLGREHQRQHRDALLRQRMNELAAWAEDYGHGRGHTLN